MSEDGAASTPACNKRQAGEAASIHPLQDRSATLACLLSVSGTHEGNTRDGTRPDTKSGRWLVQPVTNISDFIWAGLWNGEAVIPSPRWPSSSGCRPVVHGRPAVLPDHQTGGSGQGLFAGRKGEGAGEISPFAALSTALSGQVGTGNLAGGRHRDRAGRSRGDFLDVGHRAVRHGTGLCRRVARDCYRETTAMGSSAAVR